MGVTHLKGRPRPWKVDHFELAIESGRVVKKRRAKFFRTREQADEFWHRKALELDAYESGISRIIPVRFAALAEDLKSGYFAYKSIGYRKGEKSRIARAIEWFGAAEVHRIVSSEIQARLFHMLDDGQSTKSVANMHGLLSVIFKQAKIRQHITENPMASVPRPAVIPRNDVRALSEIELARLLKYEGEHMDRILLFVHTGVRMGEMCRLRVERDVDLSANVVHIRSIEGAATKNRKPRTVPLTGVARGIFAKIRVGPPLNMTRHGFEKVLRRVGDEIGVKINAHRLRHTFCSLNMANGVPEPVVQRWLGHGSATITRRYTHLAGYDQQWATLNVGEKLSCTTVARKREKVGCGGSLRNGAGSG